jgi:hypothetical protein
VISYWDHFRVFVNNGNLRLVTLLNISIDPNWIGIEQVGRVELKEVGGKRMATLRPVGKQEFLDR